MGKARKALKKKRVRKNLLPRLRQISENISIVNRLIKELK